MSARSHPIQQSPVLVLVFLLDPVIQIVRILMAAQTTGEPGEDTLWMGLSVTLLAFGHCLVHVIVTLYARNIVVFCRACLKKLELLAVTCATVLVRRIRTVCYNKGHVRLVTLAAILV